MDKAAIIIGGRGGIGAAMAHALEGDYAVHRLTRAQIELNDEATIIASARHFAGQGVAPELVLVATGLLHSANNGPEKSMRELDPEWMLENYRVNAIGPALVAKHFLPLMPRDGRAVFAVLSARVGSISDNRLGGWHSYRASKAALNMLVRNLSIEWQRKNPEAIIVALHPGTVDTALSAAFRGNPATERFAPAMAAGQLLAVLDGLNPEHSGQLVSYDGSVIAP